MSCRNDPISRENFFWEAILTTFCRILSRITAATSFCRRDVLGTRKNDCCTTAFFFYRRAADGYRLLFITTMCFNCLSEKLCDIPCGKSIDIVRKSFISLIDFAQAHQHIIRTRVEFLMPVSFATSCTVIFQTSFQNPFTSFCISSAGVKVARMIDFPVFCK